MILYREQVEFTANHTLGVWDIDFIYNLKQDPPTHQIFNIVDGEIIEI